MSNANQMNILEDASPCPPSPDLTPSLLKKGSPENLPVNYRGWLSKVVFYFWNLFYPISIAIICLPCHLLGFTHT